MGWLNIHKKLKFLFSVNILLVSETHFRNKSYCRIFRYILYHTMHPNGKAHGGTALTIRSDIKQYEIGKFQREFLQTTRRDRGSEWLYYYFKHILTI